MRGPQGPQGIKGGKGPKGTPGPHGDKGQKGDIVSKRANDDNSFSCYYFFAIPFLYIVKSCLHRSQYWRCFSLLKFLV